MQQRVGHRGKTFGLIKFATMLKDSPNMGAGSITLRDDPRVLPFGNLLRKTKVNELPQLINVIKGDLSLIGVRPVTRNIFENYPKDLASAAFSEKPGLSGVGSILFRDEEAILFETENPLKFHKEIISPYKLECDLWYSNNVTIGKYFLLITLTILAIVKPQKLSKITKKLGLPTPPRELTQIKTKVEDV